MSKEKLDKELPMDYKLPYDGKRSTSTSSQTSTAKSESSNTTYQTATIVNNMENKIIYQTRRQTVYTQQMAGITEIITTKHTPTMDELNEMMDLLNTDSNPSNNNKTETDQKQTVCKGDILSVHGIFRGFPKQQSGKTANGSPKATTNYETKKSNNKLKFPSPSAYQNISNIAGDEGRSRSSSSSSSNSGLSTPTLITTQETIVTEQNHTTYTENKQEQLIKLNKGQTADQMTCATKYSSKPKANDSNTQSITSTPHNVNAKDQMLSYTNNAISCNLSSNTTFDSSNQLLENLSSPSRSHSLSSVTNVESSSQLQLSCSGNGKVSKPSLTISGKQIIEPLLKPGLAYIFNIVTFDDANDPNNAVRIGSAADVFALKDAFQFYDLQVTVIDNANIEMIQATSKIIQETDFSSYSCLAVMILYNGSINAQFIDNDLYFPILENPTLKHKAKFFCIQANKDLRAKEQLHYYIVPANGMPVISSDDRVTRRGISAAELLNFHNIVEGSVSYRSERGSMFIQILSKCLKLYGSSKNIEDIIEMVTNIVKQESNYRQSPKFFSTLSQPFVFGDYVKFNRDRYKPLQSL